MILLEKVSHTPQETQKIIEKEIYPLVHLDDKILFEGDLGAGKTFMIKKILNLYLLTSEITSPTFTLINEYFLVNEKSKERTRKILHVDLYRLEEESQLWELDLITEMNKKQLILIEWGNKFQVINNWINKKIQITILNEIERKITFTQIR